MLQIGYFRDDVIRMLGKHKIRILHIWLSRSFWGILLYRFERSLFLLFGSFYRFIRIPFIPFQLLIQSYSNIDIHYKAKIKGGLSVLHSSVGCVISGQCVIGKNLTLTGGNVLGIAKKMDTESFVIGDNCTLGANATIIGPLTLADHIIIGASACVVKSCLKNKSVLIGVPAKEIE